MSVSERITTAISTQELERRWATAREVMGARKIDALVMQNCNDWLGGYVKWFTESRRPTAIPRPCSSMPPTR